MSLNLDSLHFDILFNIASRLSFSDVVHLSLTCRQLFQLLDEDSLCRRTVRSHVQYTREAQLAEKKTTSYRKALETVFARRGAFATATPESACVVGYGSSFVYRQGVLCYLFQDHVHVQDVYNSTNKGKIGTATISSYLSRNQFGGSEIQPEISLIHYSDGVVSLHFDYSESDVDPQWRDDEHWLIYVKLREYDADTAAGIYIIQPPASASKIFVRNTASYYYYGTHTGIGSHGHHEWKIQGLSLSDDHPLPADMPPLKLDEFVGSDLGSTVVFEIHEGYFYAVSNQTSFVVEEVDWTSFYHCVRFPLDRPVRQEVETNTRVYRRQHAEGPINDSWTELSLQVDEKTNALRIVEARREWRNGGSKQERAFYTQSLHFAPSAPAKAASPDTLSASPSASLDHPDDADDDNQSAQQPAQLLPAHDPLVRILGSGNNPHYAPARPRLSHLTHHERRHPSSHAGFILARTKLRAYNLSCSAFLDLVEDETCCPDNVFGPPCLRLRIGARRPRPLMAVPERSGSAKGKGKLVEGRESRERESELARDSDSRTAQSSHSSALLPAEDPFRYPPIRLWPPERAATTTTARTTTSESGPQCSFSCATKLHGILNAPPASFASDGVSSPSAASPASVFAFSSLSAPPPATDIVAASDERGVVFLRQPKYGARREGPIVLIGFDRGIDVEKLVLRRDGTEPVTVGNGIGTSGRKDSGVYFDGAVVEGGMDNSRLFWTRSGCEERCGCANNRVQT